MVVAQQNKNLLDLEERDEKDKIYCNTRSMMKKKLQQNWDFFSCIIILPNTQPS